jgi:hypothetical protein
VAGLKTSNGSRCWLDVYPAAEDSAPFIQQLTNAGAILVGKLNCTQFCDGQDPSERYVLTSITYFPLGEKEAQTNALTDLRKLRLLTQGEMAIKIPHRPAQAQLPLLQGMTGSTLLLAQTLAVRSGTQLE